MAKAVKKKSAKETSELFHSIIKSSITIDNSKTYLDAVTHYLKKVKGKPITKDLPHDIIEAIAMEGSVPVVISVHKHHGTLIKTPLIKWLSENE